MKIAFDAKRITSNVTGLGNYGRFVVNAFSRQFQNDQLLLFSPHEARDAVKAVLPVFNNISYCLPDRKMGQIRRSLWRVHGIVNDLKLNSVDLYHGLSNELPLGIRKTGIPAVVTIHDLIFLHYPQFYKTIDRKIYEYKFRSACHSADHIIAVSEATKRDVIAAYNVPEKKVSVVYQGCNDLFCHDVPASQKVFLREKYNLSSEYILSVGTVEQRKNLLLTVKALKESGLDLKLLVIGKQTPYAEQVKIFIRENGMEEQVLFLHLTDSSELPAIYQMASLFVYPSLIEGFGIPVLEALNSGTPVIGATGSCLEEAGGPDSLYVDPTNHHELAAKMKHVLHNPQVAGEMSWKGKKYAERFLPENLSCDLMNVYKRVL